VDADTRELLAGSIRELLGSGADVVAGLEELGWSDVVDDDPAAAIDLLFAEQGISGASSAALDTVAVARLDDGRVRPVVHPVGREFSALVEGRTLVIDGVVLGDTAGTFIVVSEGGSHVVDTEAHGVPPTPVGGFDPPSKLHRVTLTVDLGDVAEGSVDWPTVTATARRALASELVGNATAMLALATEQITARHQFGKPLGANQSPRHRLAEGYAHVRGAAELVTTAWHTRTPEDALAAKAYAGRASDITSRACLQVCGAIGLTTEHALPGFVKRARVLDALYGGWQWSTRRIGTGIASTSRIPTSGRL
jgi:alkylation response protein AidB-like acyl-CoA dehydrogenase